MIWYPLCVQWFACPQQPRAASPAPDAAPVPATALLEEVWHFIWLPGQKWWVTHWSCSYPDSSPTCYLDYWLQTPAYKAWLGDHPSSPKLINIFPCEILLTSKAVLTFELFYHFSLLHGNQASVICQLYSEVTSLPAKPPWHAKDWAAERTHSYGGQQNAPKLLWGRFLLNWKLLLLLHSMALQVQTTWHIKACWQKSEVWCKCHTSLLLCVMCQNSQVGI